MTWSLRGLSGPTVVASGDITLTEPAGTAEGDLLHVQLAFRLDAPFTGDAAWTERLQHLATSTGTSSAPASMYVASLVRGASAPDLTFTRTGGDVCLGRVIAHYSDSGVPTYDTHASRLDSPFTGKTIIGGLTTAEANELLLFFGVGEGNWSNIRSTDPGTASGATDTTTAPTVGAWIERADSLDATGLDVGSVIADAVKSTAGNTGDITGTFSSANVQPVLAVAYYEAVGSGVTVSPTTGRADVTGYAPTVLQPATIAPGGGEVTATGYMPGISQVTGIRPGAGHATLIGYAPTVAQGAGRLLSPGAGRATFTGYAPDISVAYLTEYEVITNAGMGGSPRNAVYGEGRLFVSTIDQPTQNVRISRLEGATWTHVTVWTHADSAANIHNNASVSIDGDGYVYAALCEHVNNLPVKVFKSATPYALDFGSATDVFSGDNYSYPMLVWFSGEMWLFIRVGGNRDLYYKRSGDGGATWSAATRLYNSGTGNRAYGEISVVGSELCLATSFSNPGDVPQGTNDGFFARWNGTNWLSAAGSTYTLPISSATTEKFFDAAAADRDMGFFAETVKDTSGRYVIYTTGLTDTLTDKLYMCRYDSGWSQTEVVIPGATFKEMPHCNEADAYDFVALADYSGTVQFVRCTSADSGATWSFQRLTDGALTRTRGNARRVRNRPDPTWLLYADITRTSETAWTSDIYTTFNDTGLVAPTPGSVDLTGYAPALTQPNALAPGAGSVTFSGYAPTLTQGAGQLIAPAPGRADATGYAPAVLQPATVAPGAGSVTATGYAPAISQLAAIRPPAGHVTITGYAPALTLPRALAPTAGRAEVSGYAPTVSQSMTVAPAAGRAEATGYAPTVTRLDGQTIAPTAGRVDLSGHAPIIVQGATLSPTTGRIEITGYGPSITQASGPTVSPTAGSAEYHGYAPSLRRTWTRTLPLSSRRALPLRWS